MPPTLGHVCGGTQPLLRCDQGLCRTGLEKVSYSHHETSCTYSQNAPISAESYHLLQSTEQIEMIEMTEPDQR